MMHLWKAMMQMHQAGWAKESPLTLNLFAGARRFAGTPLPAFTGGASATLRRPELSNMSGP
jgi:hypothetical protein